MLKKLIPRFLFFSDISDLHKKLQESRRKGILLTRILNKSRSFFIKEREHQVQIKEENPEDILAELER